MKIQKILLHYKFAIFFCWIQVLIIKVNSSKIIIWFNLAQQHYLWLMFHRYWGFLSLMFDFVISFPNPTPKNPFFKLFSSFNNKFPKPKKPAFFLYFLLFQIYFPSKLINWWKINFQPTSCIFFIFLHTRECFKDELYSYMFKIYLFKVFWLFKILNNNLMKHTT